LEHGIAPSLLLRIAASFDAIFAIAAANDPDYPGLAMDCNIAHRPAGGVERAKASSEQAEFAIVTPPHNTVALNVTRAGRTLQ
jgi:hypothetical protein